MIPDTEAAKIAATLTKAQRWAIEKGSGYMIAHSTGPACRSALQRKGVVIDRMYSERLTPLGLRVRAALQNREAGDE